MPAGAVVHAPPSGVGDGHAQLGGWPGRERKRRVRGLGLAPDPRVRGVQQPCPSSPTRDPNCDDARHAPPATQWPPRAVSRGVAWDERGAHRTRATPSTLPPPPTLHAPPRGVQQYVHGLVGGASNDRRARLPIAGVARPARTAGSALGRRYVCGGGPPLRGDLQVLSSDDSRSGAAPLLRVRASPSSTHTCANIMHDLGGWFTFHAAPTPLFAQAAAPFPGVSAGRGLGCTIQSSLQRQPE